MGLIGNMAVLNTGVHRPFGDQPATRSGALGRYSAFSNTRSQDGATTVLSGLSHPVGMSPGKAWIPPQLSGEISVRADATGSLTANLYPSLSMDVAFTGVGSLVAAAVLLRAMATDLTGTGSVSADIQGRYDTAAAFSGSGVFSAGLMAYANAVLSATGAGTLTAAAERLVIMAVALAGTGEITASGVGGINVSVDLSGSGDLEAAIQGLLAAACDLSGVGDLEAGVVGRINAAAALAGDGDLNAAADLVATMVLAMAGVGGLSAGIQGRLNAALALTGAGDLDASAARWINAAVALAGSSTFVSAVSGRGSLTAALSGVGDLEAAVNAIASMEIDIVVTGAGLTTSNIGPAVWDSLVGGHQATGTFGEAIGQGAAGITQQQIRDAMTLAASAGTPGSGSVDQLLLDIYRILGLDPTIPLVHTPAGPAQTREAGDVIQDIDEDLDGTVTVTRRP